MGRMLRRDHQRLVVWTLIVVALSSLSVGGCGGSGSSGPPILTSIAITPANATLIVGSSQQLVAQGNYSDGTTQDISALVAWSSSDQTLASISSSGLASTAAIGRPQITATSGDITGSTRLVVVEGAWVARFAYAVSSPTTYIYTVDAASGQLRATGSVPADAMSIAIDPAGKFAYTAGTDAYAIDPANGGFTFIATYSTNYGPYNFVGVDPSGSFVYVTVGTDCPIGGAILGYAIDRVSGKLTPIAGSPFVVRARPFP